MPAPLRGVHEHQAMLPPQAPPAHLCRQREKRHLPQSHVLHSGREALQLRRAVLRNAAVRRYLGRRAVRPAVEGPRREGRCRFGGRGGGAGAGGIPPHPVLGATEEATVRHIGPMARDFAAFPIGDDERHIHAVDAQGVALAAIQGLIE